jgi:hypothetical protein
MWWQKLNLALTVLVRVAIAVNNTIELYEQGRLLKGPKQNDPERTTQKRPSNRL